jgi:hypothetical protein
MNEDIPSPVSLARSIFRRLSFWCRVLVTTACELSVGGLMGAEAPTFAVPLFHEATHQFKTMTTTRYQHQTRVDRTAGSYRYDCVGFVSYALKQAAPQAWESAFKALDIKPGRIPSPAKYRAFFASLAEKPQSGWQAVTKVSELRPGDVVVWEQETKTASGHAVVIGGIPVAGPDGAWVVEVYDSTASPHGDDSRPNDLRAEVLATKGQRSGLGRGMMAFAADPATGTLTGYRWSPKSKPNTVPIAAARPTS